MTKFAKRASAWAGAVALLSVATTVMAVTTANANDKKLTIGLALYSQLQPRWLFDAKAFVAEAEKNGDTVIVQYADTDPAKQTTQVQNMLSCGINVLAIASADIAVGANLIEAARKEGVKTIAYDIGIRDAAPDWMIVRNQSMVGKLQVEAALKFAPKGNYAVLKGDSANDLAQQSSAVYAKLLPEAAGVNVIYNDFIPGWSPATAEKTAEDILTRNKDQVAAFIVNNDGMATGAVQALRGANLNGKVFVSGLDADEANLHLIALGDQTMTVFTPIDQMARLAADAAHELGNGRKPAADRMYSTKKGDVPMKELSLVSVTKDNVCDFVRHSAPQGWANPEVVFKGTKVSCP